MKMYLVDHIVYFLGELYTIQLLNFSVYMQIFRKPSLQFLSCSLNNITIHTTHEPPVDYLKVAIEIIQYYVSRKEIITFKRSFKIWIYWYFIRNRFTEDIQIKYVCYLFDARGTRFFKNENSLRPAATSVEMVDFNDGIPYKQVFHIEILWSESNLDSWMEEE